MTTHEPMQVARRLQHMALNWYRIIAGHHAPAATALLAELPAPFGAQLASLYRGEPQRGSDGAMYPIHRNTQIAPSQGLWLYRHALACQPRASLEIGMAYGYSTLFLLAAAAQRQAGHHVAIDPYQTSAWHGIGLEQVRAVQSSLVDSSVFHLIEDRSDHAAIDLNRSQQSFDMIFIDGNHRFDDVIVDFTLFAPLCAVNGVIILDDYWMPSIRTVVGFIRRNRTDFREIPTNEPNIIVFRRIADDSRTWNHFRRFPVAHRWW